jgi:hypothetical protein
MSLDFHCVERRGVQRTTLRRPVYLRAGTLHALYNLPISWSIEANSSIGKPTTLDWLPSTI